MRELVCKTLDTSIIYCPIFSPYLLGSYCCNVRCIILIIGVLGLSWPINRCNLLSYKKGLRVQDKSITNKSN